MAFERLKHRFANDTHWSGHQIGLASRDAILKMNIDPMDVLSSFLRKLENPDSTHQVDVQVKRMDGIFDQILSGRCRPFVKIDTQGFELEVIKGFSDRTKDVIGWQLEMSVEPLYGDQPKIEEIIGLMRDLGFSLWRLLPGLRDPNTLQSYEFDGIFFRNK